MRIFWVVQAVAFAGAAVALTSYYWPLRLPPTHPVDAQLVTISDGHVRIIAPGRDLVGDVADFDDALFAFLMYDYLRARPALADKTVMLTSMERGGQPVYRVLVHLSDDLLEGMEFLAQLKAENLTSSLRYQWVLRHKFMSYLNQTTVFVNAYSGPASDRIEALHASDLRGYLRRFIRFKSETDSRISNGLETIPSPLTRQDASRLAADIIAVAQFYTIPVDLFLGIGAMENNYMNVAGDLKNTIWKQRPQPGDIVLKKGRGRVLVRNDSMGVWQINHESLRYAHKLYGKDKRDYRQLPERLIPPKELDLDKVDPEVLTTYAGSCCEISSIASTAIWRWPRVRTMVAQAILTLTMLTASRWCPAMRGA